MSIGRQVFLKEKLLGFTSDKHDYTRCAHVTLRLYEHNGAGRLLVNHEPAPATFLTVSLSGQINLTQDDGRGGGGVSGQIVDRLHEVKSLANGVTRAQFDRLIELWRRWHSNDLRAACIHQQSFALPHGVLDRQWPTRAAAETAKCPVGYRYGSDWLVELVPQEVIDELKSLMS